MIKLTDFYLFSYKILWYFKFRVKRKMLNYKRNKENVSYDKR